MFDGLKEKLDSFTDEAEEDVDEEALEAAEAEAEEAAAPDAEDMPPDAEDVPAETDTAAADSDGAQEADANAGDPETVPPEQGHAPADDEPVDQTAVDEWADDSGAVAAEGAEDAPAPATAEPAADDAEEQPAEDAETEAADEPSEADADDAEEGRGLTERAKLFATGKTVIDEEDLQSHLDDLEFALLGSDVELQAAREILDGVEENLVGETRRRLKSTGNLVQDALREALYDVISVGQFDFDGRVEDAEKPFVIIFTGVNGVGKTTTIAKMAQYFEERGLSTVLANGDTFRAGANEQLEQHAENLDKRVISHEKGSDPAAVIYDAVEYADANDVDVVLGDTAGRLHTSDGLMDQLAKIDRVIEPDMTLFVDEAVAGQDAVTRAREFDDASDIDGTVLTKADADSQGGAAISIAHVTGKPILFLGTGQEYDDLERFDPERIVDQLLGEE
ncbi:signal recognition particle-docking protein FtsY [Halobacteriales archaeon QS_4_66_20]|nr:MAG: signal recognition particle-docking protein FtsY [Halobacteriales archaeon QS_4_66_20]